MRGAWKRLSLQPVAPGKGGEGQPLRTQLGRLAGSWLWLRDEGFEPNRNLRKNAQSAGWGGGGGDKKLQNHAMWEGLLAPCISSGTLQSLLNADGPLSGMSSPRTRWGRFTWVSLKENYAKEGLKAGSWGPAALHPILRGTLRDFRRYRNPWPLTSSLVTECGVAVRCLWQLRVQGSDSELVSESPGQVILSLGVGGADKL